MTMELLPLTLYCFSMTATPGPNNLILTATGANHGYRRALPHIIGALASIPVMATLVGLGLGRVILASEAAHTALNVAGTSYMLWLAWKITRWGGRLETQAPEGDEGGATGESPSEAPGEVSAAKSEQARADASGRAAVPSAEPLTFTQAALFQWLNPKCWMMYVGAVSLFATGQDVLGETMLIAAVFTALIFPSFSFWALLGQAVGRFLNSRARVAAFNWSLALLLVGSLVLAQLPG